MLNPFDKDLQHFFQQMNFCRAHRQLPAKFLSLNNIVLEIP